MILRLRPIPAFVSACLLSALVGCSSSSTTASKSQPTPTSSPIPKATQGPLAVATSYEVAAKDGVSDDDLAAAAKKVRKIVGVQKVTVTAHHLRADLTLDQPNKDRLALIAALKALGVVTVPEL